MKACSSADDSKGCCHCGRGRRKWTIDTLQGAAGAGDIGERSRQVSDVISEPYRNHGAGILAKDQTGQAAVWVCGKQAFRKIMEHLKEDFI